MKVFFSLIISNAGYVAKNEIKLEKIGKHFIKLARPDIIFEF